MGQTDNSATATTVRTRMAPSPTGRLHLGTAYATLWPYLFARKSKGVFILRIEDTDQARSTKEFETDIITGLKNLGFNWDEDVAHQMDRLELYQKYTDQLLTEDKAYYCFCSKEELDAERQEQITKKLPQIYSGKCRVLSKEEALAKKEAGQPYVVRFKLAENHGPVEFEDLLHGKITFDPKLLGDMVIMRQNGIALYNFAVVIDDIDMKISHVIRGDDHLSNTPKQVLFFEAFGKTPPVFVHYPMVLNQDRMGKLSKRTGSTSVGDYLKDGYLPEALVNYLALLGMTPPNGKEIFSLTELIEIFDIKYMNTSAGAWGEQKLDWLNGEYIRQMSDDELAKRLEDFLVDHPAISKLKELVPLVKERMKKLSDFVLLTDFLFEKPEYDWSVFEQLKIKDLKTSLERVKETLEGLTSPWKAEEFEQAFRKLAEELGLSASVMFQLLRVAVSGQLVTPPLFECLQILGEDETKIRIGDLISNLPEIKAVEY